MAATHTQSPEAYTRQRALDLRHDWQLSRLFLPRDSRECFNALLALRAELAEQVGKVSDPAVAAAKLEWWRAELERGFSDTAQHPLAIHLASLLRDKGIAIEYALEQIDAIEMASLPGGIASLADEKLFRYRRDGVLAEIALLLSGDGCNPDDRSIQAAARAIGEVRSHADAITSISMSPSSGVTAFSSATLADHEIHPETEISSNSLQALVNEQWQNWDNLRVAARTAIEDVALPPALQVQWDLLEADYRALMKQRNSVKVESLPLSRSLPGPLRRLFIAWRAARKAARQQNPTTNRD